MPFNDGEYTKRTVTAVRDNIITEAKRQLGNRNFIDGAVLESTLSSVAQTVVDEIEPLLAQTHDTAYLQTATGEYLTLKAAEKGVQRRPAIKATGVAEFTRSNPPSSDITVPKGTVVTTEGANPVRFKTTEVGQILAQSSQTDSTTYSTTSTAYVQKTSFDVDVTYRDTLDVQGDIRTTNSSYTASLEIKDTTNSTVIDTGSTTSTTAVTVGPTAYDVSSLSGTITIAYRIKISNSSGSAELPTSTVTKGGEMGVQTNISAIEGGDEGNLGPDTLTVLPSPPSGVEAVTNPNPTGDPAYNLTGGVSQTLGLDRETDAELRERALSTETFGGAATVANIKKAITSLDGDATITLYTNRTTSQNGSGNGLDPLAMEPVILQRGISDKDIANALHDTVAPTSRLQSGVNGTSVTHTISDETLATNRTYEWSNPNEITTEIDFDLVVDDTYVGDAKVKQTIVNIVGGTDGSGAPVVGLDIGDDLIVDTLEGAVTGLQGVIGADVITIDTNADGTDDTTTGTNGLRRLNAAKNEVITTDVSAGLVTITTTVV